MNWTLKRWYGFHINWMIAIFTCMECWYDEYDSCQNYFYIVAHASPCHCFLLQNTKTAELIWPPLAYKSCIVFILKLSILTMLLTLFALFTLHRARRGHPVTPPCLHNCALSAQFYTQPWEPPLHCTWSLHSISTKTWCADPHFSRACGRVYDEWQSNVALQYLSHPCSRFGLSFILLLTVLSVLT